MILIGLLKRSYNYVMVDKKFLLFILTITCLWSIGNSLLPNSIYGFIFILCFLFFYVGYGMEVTKDIINGGTRLPKLRPKQIIIGGIQGGIIYSVYILLETLVENMINYFVILPSFDLKHIILNLNDIYVYFSNPSQFLSFLIISFTLIYLFVFFMKIGFACVADTGRIRDGLNIKHCWNVIKKIGFKHYIECYTSVLIINIILILIANFTFKIPIINFIIDLLSFLALFIIEYVSIANLYLYKNHGEIV